MKAIKIKINKKKIQQSSNLDFSFTYDYLLYMNKIIDILARHNKNYTKEQHNYIMDLQSIIEAIEIEG